MIHVFRGGYDIYVTLLHVNQLNKLYALERLQDSRLFFCYQSISYIKPYITRNHLYNVHCTLYKVQCILYNVQCITKASYTLSLTSHNLTSTMKDPWGIMHNACTSIEWRLYLGQNSTIQVVIYLKVVIYGTSIKVPNSPSSKTSTVSHRHDYSH